MTTYWLSTHLEYACRHTGACCTSRWPIPIEPDRAAAVRAAIGRGDLVAPAEWNRVERDGSHQGDLILAHQPSGACIFHRAPVPAGAAPGCAIHPWRPRSCEHFPFVCVIDPRGVHVTLSHYCPTAASLLFDATGVPHLVEGPAVLDGGRLPEGLDAREALPPADESGTRLLSWAEVTAFEAALIHRLATDASVPPPPSAEMFERARAAVLPGWTWPAMPASADAAWQALVAPAWAGWASVIGRYLAARAHASWAMQLGTDPRAVEKAVELARAVLQMEAIRACLAQQAPLDRPTLTGAIRQADLLLVHLANPGALIAD